MQRDEADAMLATQRAEAAARSAARERGAAERLIALEGFARRAIAGGRIARAMLRYRGGDMRERRAAAATAIQAVARGAAARKLVDGRGLHSSTSQLNLSRV